MKNKKKLLSVLLIFVMTVSVFHGYAAKAADTVKVTLRLEQDNKTLVTPVEVTLTDEDKKDYGIGLITPTVPDVPISNFWASISKTPTAFKPATIAIKQKRSPRVLKSI